MNDTYPISWSREECKQASQDSCQTTTVCVFLMTILNPIFHFVEARSRLKAGKTYAVGLQTLDSCKCVCYFGILNSNFENIFLQFFPDLSRSRIDLSVLTSCNVIWQRKKALRKTRHPEHSYCAQSSSSWKVLWNWQPIASGDFGLLRWLKKRASTSPHPWQIFCSPWLTFNLLKLNITGD